MTIISIINKNNRWKELDGRNRKVGSRTKRGKTTEPMLKGQSETDLVTAKKRKTKKQKRGTGHLFLFCTSENLGKKSTTRCISNCSGIWGIGRISYCYTGSIGEGALHVSYCSTGPWLAERLLSGPLLGSARCWLLQPGAHSSAISSLKSKNKKQT